MGNVCEQTPIQQNKKNNTKRLVEQQGSQVRTISDIHSIQNIVWIDKNVKNIQNKSYEKKLKRKFHVESYNSPQTYLNTLDQRNPNQKALLICSASLPQKYYQQFNKNTNISEIILFCMNQLKALTLIKNYQKIKRSFFSFNQLQQFLSDRKTLLQLQQQKNRYQQKPKPSKKMSKKVSLKDFGQQDIFMFNKKTQDFLQ